LHNQVFSDAIRVCKPIQAVAAAVHQAARFPEVVLDHGFLDLPFFVLEETRQKQSGGGWISGEIRILNQVSTHSLPMFLVIRATGQLNVTASTKSFTVISTVI